MTGKPHPQKPHKERKWLCRKDGREKVMRRSNAIQYGWTIIEEVIEE